MVDAYVDSYLQFRVIFSLQDVRRLENKGKLFCRVERSNRKSIRRKKYPLWFYKCDEDRPREDELRPWKDNGRQKYQFYLSKRRLESIKHGKIVGADSPHVWVRDTSISLEGVL